MHLIKSVGSDNPYELYKRIEHTTGIDTAMGKEKRNIILETKRLVLEEITTGHFQELYKLLSNKIVHKYFPKALNKAESEDSKHSA